MQPARRPSQPAVSFRDLRVWQEAIKLVVDVRPLCANLRQSRHWDLADQLRRAARSVHANLAEGWGRRTVRDRAKFYTESWSSLQEVETLLIEASTDDCTPAELLQPCIRRVHNTTRLLSAFRRATREKTESAEAEDGTAEDGTASNDEA
ncbi:hypothetical protein rosag_01300 [Roseisolibacter agri]|uniref:Four helix bundle protein n=2 Tax=Roseisolibacter agri TaxID=2014610 RepID=A0AA37Q2X2_9BACT|nr:hypothetical protein rosag_01300 [Roseisolibacter agri]